MWHYLTDSHRLLLPAGEVSKVNVTLVQNKAENGFEIGCSTNSGCQQSFVDFFAEINKVSLNKMFNVPIILEKLFIFIDCIFSVFVVLFCLFDKVFIGAFEFG